VGDAAGRAHRPRRLRLADPPAPRRRGHGLDVVLRGLSMICDDDRVLELAGPIFDGLYEYHRRALLLDRPPA
jgi:hypothetical protein